MLPQLRGVTPPLTTRRPLAALHAWRPPPGFPPRPSLPPPQPAAMYYGAETAGAEPGGAESEGEGSRGAATRGAATGGAGSGGAATGGAGSWGAATGGADSGGTASPFGGGAVGDPARGPGAGQPPQPDLLEMLSPQAIRASIVRRGSPGGGGYSPTSAGAASPGGAAGAGGTRGAAGARGAGAPSPRGATGAGGAAGAGSAGAGGTGGAGAAGHGGARTGGARVVEACGAARAGGAIGAAGSGGAGRTARAGGAGAGGTGGTGGTGGAGAAGPGGARTRGARAAGACGAAGAAGARGATGAAGTGGAGAGGTGGAGAAGPGGARTRGARAARAGSAAGAGDQPPPQLLPGSSLPAPAPHTEVTESLTERREPETRASTPVRARCVARPRPPAVPSTHVTDPESDLARAASPTDTRLLTTIVTNHDLESTVAFALVTELVDFAARSRLDYVASIFIGSESVSPPSIGGDPALRSDVLEDRQFELECLVAALPHFALMLLCPEGDPNALDIPTPRSYADAIVGPSALRLLDLLATAHSFVYWPLALSSTFRRVRRAECCEAKIYAGAMVAQELRWLTNLLTDLGERPRSPLVLYINNKAMLALCHEQRLEHRTKHIALHYFLARELQQRRQLCLSYMASRANTVHVFTKALGSGDHQRFCTALGLVPTLPHLLVA
ncbi:unnamed protein product [Closterium sp. NIES-54]